MVIHLKGRITDEGELKLDLPSGLPAGEAQITIEIPTEARLTPKRVARTLTEERKVAWRIQGTGPDPAHWLVIFKKVGQGEILFQTLHPGQVFKKPFLTSADTFEAYAISADENLRHEFSRKYLSGDQARSFTLDFKLYFRVQDAERLGSSLSGGDPLERLQEEVARVLSATARRFSWESMKQEGEDFGLRLRETEIMDEEGESRTNFRHLQDFASTLGLELRHLDILCSLTELDLAYEKWNIEFNSEALVSERVQLTHELQTLKDQRRAEGEIAMAPTSSQALRDMERLRLILDTIAERGVQGIHQSAGELRSFDAIHRALIEIQGIQASLAVLPGETIHPYDKPRGALAMLGFAKRFRKTRRTEDWMAELREGES